MSQTWTGDRRRSRFACHSCKGLLTEKLQIKVSLNLLSCNFSRTAPMASECATPPTSRSRGRFQVPRSAVHFVTRGNIYIQYFRE